MIGVNAGAAQANAALSDLVLYPQQPPGRASAAKSRRTLGGAALAQQLITEHPEWTYRRIAEEVNARIEGAGASEKSVRWYHHQMRRHMAEGTNGVRT